MIFLSRILITILALIAVTIHLTKWRDIQFSWEAMALLLIALLPWFPAFVESFKLGKDSVELKLREIEKKADAAIDASLRGTVKNPNENTATETAGITDGTVREAINPDPQKGKWGGKPSDNGRLLSAKIEKIPDENFFRRVVLRVESIDPAKPLAGSVIFHLHPTFRNPDLEIPVTNGTAETSLISYGVFTIGAEVVGEPTRLELDLASLNDGKDQFFNR